MISNRHLIELFFGYSLHEDTEELTKEEEYVDDALNVIEIIKRMIKTDDIYYNPTYGSNGNKLYIDGSTEYLNQQEKDLIIKFFGDSIWSEKKEN